MNDPNRRTGSCHCGAVRYEVTIDLSQPVVSCNCSLCIRSGALLGFVPAAQFTLLAGEDAQTDYQFHRKIIHHLFCTTCGVRSFARGTLPGAGDMVAVNVRCLDGIEIDKLTFRYYDGKNA